MKIFIIKASNTYFGTENGTGGIVFQQWAFWLIQGFLNLAFCPDYI